MIRRISRIFAERPSEVYVEPVVPTVGDVLDLQEDIQQAEVDANLAVAWLDHQRRLFEIVCKGMSRASNKS